MAIKNLITLISILFLVSCNKTNMTIDKGDDVTLILEIENPTDIVAIEFSSREDTITVDKEDIDQFNQFTYTLDVAGEDGLRTCIYTTDQIICREDYVERGYKIKLNFKNNELTAKNSLLLY